MAEVHSAAAAEDRIATPPPPPPSKYTLTYKESVKQWWGALSLEKAETNLLNFIPFVSNPSKDDGRRTPSSLQVDIGNGQHINEFSVDRSDAPNNHLVILHGYGAGLGFFYRNFDALSSVQGWNLHAIDLLGYGRSSRPKFLIKAKNRQDQITEAENWFVDAIERWREKRNIEKFTLVGHSLGGYLGAAYAMKYPERLEKLILASPVGVPRNPYEDAPEDDPPIFNQDIKTSMEAEVLQSQNSATSTRGRDRNMPSWLVWLWEKNVSPFSFIRNTGPLGPFLVSIWSGRRFSLMPEQEKIALHNYAYSLFSAKGSGEYCLGYLLSPGAYARRPIIDNVSKIQCPTLWLYGENDWMEADAGAHAVKKLDSLGRKAALQILPSSGHHLYLDNVPAFNKAVIDQLLSS